MKKSDPPITAVQTYKTTLSDLWSAITNAERMRKWYFNTIHDFEAREGFEVVFDVECEGENFPHRWKVTEAVFEKLLKYTWKFDGYDGAATATFRLEKEGESATLAVSFQTTEDFTAPLPQFQREACQGGWKYFIEESLKSYLESY